MNTPSAPHPLGEAFVADFAALAARVPAAIGIAIAAPRHSSAHALGPWSAGVAWSTIKVPVAIAALRADRRRAEPLAIKAITESDNPASEELWALLGEPAKAARAVQSVITAAGDSLTVVESQRVRPGFTAFGQTVWPLDRQAIFAANLGAVPEAAPVIDLMLNLIPEHRWALAAKGFAAKGGWGPDAGDGYLVRQWGIVPDGPTGLGVALAARADTFEAGIAVLDAMTECLCAHLRGD
ncbi:hypothetical protein [Mycobacterium sp.]|uniref:hypothetical protein n=1 Tax=Mycobacterium sp. TaxID=1785 RepID=UPI003A889016